MASSSARPLEEIYKALVIADDEDDDGIVLERGILSGKETVEPLILVGRLLTDKPVKFMVLKDTMAGVWRPARGVMVKELEYNLFLFQFYHMYDLTRILNDGPWSFDQQLLILHQLKPDELPKQIELVMAQFWVQIHDLPIGFWTEQIAVILGDTMGSFVKTDHRNFDGAWHKFMLVRVEIDVRKPLRRRIKLKSEGGEWFCVSLKYERLPTFCFLCGLLGHSDRFCHQRTVMTGAILDLPYGQWLRAENRRGRPSLGRRWLVEGGGEGRVTGVTAARQSMHINDSETEPIRIMETPVTDHNKPNGKDVALNTNNDANVLPVLHGSG